LKGVTTGLFPHEHGCDVTHSSATLGGVPHQNCDAPQLAIQRSLRCPFHERVHSLHFFEQRLNGMRIRNNYENEQFNIEVEADPAMWESRAASYPEFMILV
jgi:hypothetical protein